MIEQPEFCLICRQLMDVPGKPETANCGGDCCRCMAEAGDTDCQRVLGWHVDISDVEELEGA